MRLSWSIATSRRAFGKAMRRIRPTLESLAAEIEAVPIQYPIHEAVLVGITDNRDDMFFEEVPNHDGFFQVLTGFDASVDLTSQNDANLKKMVFDKLRQAVIACPFSRPDREAFEGFFDLWA